MSIVVHKCPTQAGVAVVWTRARGAKRRGRVGWTGPQKPEDSVRTTARREEGMPTGQLAYLAVRPTCNTSSVCRDNRRKCPAPGPTRQKLSRFTRVVDQEHSPGPTQQTGSANASAKRDKARAEVVDRTHRVSPALSRGYLLSACVCSPSVPQWPSISLNARVVRGIE